ncbi:hypothetical protein BRARA_D00200 [Brassica rapa]|uniref:Uncharacterized protein n=1 Tax=Brassica campestris TaxID=3711 RepID=A0A397ZJ08_BRACM|nr:hypothetical protein BRARA_D00200 [Brassica rapa]
MRIGSSQVPSKEKDRSKIFVIDADGTRTKDIARASRKLGMKQFCLLHITISLESIILYEQLLNSITCCRYSSVFY